MPFYIRFGGAICRGLRRWLGLYSKETKNKKSEAKARGTHFKKSEAKKKPKIEIKKEFVFNREDIMDSDELTRLFIESIESMSSGDAFADVKYEPKKEEIYSKETKSTARSESTSGTRTRATSSSEKSSSMFKKDVKVELERTASKDFSDIKMKSDFGPVADEKESKSYKATEKQIHEEKPARKLHHCQTCDKKEPSVRTFKKCGL